MYYDGPAGEEEYEGPLQQDIEIINWALDRIYQPTPMDRFQN